jgi:hypothetical protein
VSPKKPTCPSFLDATSPRSLQTSRTDDPDLPTVPAQGGYLPYFILLGSVFGVYNAVQGHVVQWQTREIYSKKAHEGEWTSAQSHARP